MRKPFTKLREQPLGLLELIAIAIGGMVGGGIFSILGVSVETIGNATPIALLFGGFLAFLAAYSYIQLALYYKDEGATYSFFKKTFPSSHFAASAIGWYVVFGYISTLALYSFTFASYIASTFPPENYELMKTIIAGAVLVFFMTINIVSVKGMGRLEDFIVYLKLTLLVLIAIILSTEADIDSITPLIEGKTSFANIIMIGSFTFVAFEGFQLVIHAMKEMKYPNKNIPRSIYGSIGIVSLLYIALATTTLLSISKSDIIAGKEFALAAGTQAVLGNAGLIIVIFGAVLATASAINGTIFGASRLMAVIAEDGYFPSILAVRKNGFIPFYSVIIITLLAYPFIFIDGLETIIEYGSITFIGVSFLMAYANFKIRKKTNSSFVMTLAAMLGLAGAALAILIFEVKRSPQQLLIILLVFTILTSLAWLSTKKKIKEKEKV